MNVLILTFGSRGDVQPYVALGKGLQTAGHAVTVCTCSSFASFVTSHGLNYAHASDDLMRLMASVEGRDAMEDAGGLLGLLRTNIRLMQDAKSINIQLLHDSWQAAQAADPDLVLYNGKALAAVSIAEKLDAPAMLAIPVPMIVPTANSPAIGLPDLNLGGWYNRLTYRLVHMGYRQYAKVLDDFRQETLGLDRWPRSSGMLQTAGGRPIPVLHFYSPHVVPRPDDWPGTAHVTGYWFLNRSEEWQPAAELQAFLDAGDPPVYVGFGSIAGRNPQRTARIVVEALQQADVRGIVATGWGGLDAGSLPDTIVQIDQAPHDWLFPRVAAVVHHGGAGTTAAGLRAGRPTVVCPFFGDQPFWGGRVQALGVGPAPIPQKKLTVEKLAAALRSVTDDAAMRERAGRLGAQIQREDGVATAIVLIEAAQPQG